MEPSDRQDRHQHPRVTQRAAAVVAIVVVVAVVAVTIGLVLRDPALLIGQAILLLVAVAAVWVAVTRIRLRRWLAVLAAVAAMAGVLAITYVRDGRIGLSLVIRLAAVLLAVSLARYALGRTASALQSRQTSGRPVPPAKRGALIINLRSGGGKAERHHLAAECARRGIAAIVLQPGDDLPQLARHAVDDGADVIGMAGGDGSQALVAGVAAERGVPMVIVPAGTRNHFALDLGLDRNDVVGALDAYGEAVERCIDLADVNGRIFVNNVSLGLYASIVSSPEYRDAKKETALEALPEMLGPGARPFDLRFSSPDGVAHTGAQVIQISNGPYGTTLGGVASRPRLDTGTLGIFVLNVPDVASATRFTACLTAGCPDRYHGFESWNAPTFQIVSDAPIPLGLDGESLEMSSPLMFSSRPSVLCVRLPNAAIGYSPAARSLSLRRLVPDLYRVVLGRSPEISD